MDLQQAWQEHKRFLIGCLIGLCVFLIARAVVDSVFDSQTVAAANQKTVTAINRDDHYGRTAQEAATEERERLAGSMRELSEAILFTPAPEFLLEGKGAPDLHYEQVSRRVRQQLVRAAAELGIELNERNLSWAPPAGGTEEIRRTLIALMLLEQGVTRLLAAHRETLAGDPDALGVTSVDSIKIEPSRADAGRARGDATSPIEEHRVAVQIHADYATLYRFLELCRAQRPPLALAPEFKLESGKRSGDPLKLTAKLVAPVLRNP